jgi:hypothetical protein
MSAAVKKACVLLAVIAAGACDNREPTEMVAGPVYDFRLAVDATSLFPGGTVNLFNRTVANVVITDSARIQLRGLGTLPSGSSYTVYGVTETTAGSAPAVLATNVIPDSTGAVLVRLPGSAVGSNTTFVVGFGGSDLAGSSAPLFFNFKNPTTGVFTTSGNLVSGQFTGTTTGSRRFFAPSSTVWGRGGLWLDQPDDNDIWLRGWIRHLPLAPNGFQWQAWAVQLKVDTIKAAARLQTLTDTLETDITNFEAPPATGLIDFPKVVFEGFKCEMGVSLESFTHVFVALEPKGYAGVKPSPAVVYRGAFPRQFTNRFTVAGSIPPC